MIPVLAAALFALRALPISAPDDAVFIGILGDGGTGGKEQKAVARQLELAREEGRLDYVFLLGDNVYEVGAAKDIRAKYLDVYRALLDGGVSFHAAIGNYDVKRCRVARVEALPPDAAAYESCEIGQHLEPENRFGYLDGHRYYRAAIAGGDRPLAEVFVVDTNTLASSQSFLARGEDRAQLEWLDRALWESKATWKIVAMHHPIHTPSAAGWFSGHDREAPLGDQLEPLFTRHGVDAVFAGHNHFYARMVPQKGIRYFVSGGGGKAMYRYEPESGYVVEEPERGKFHHFVHVRLSPERFDYCVVDEEGRIRDGGWFSKGSLSDSPFPAEGCPY